MAPHRVKQQESAIILSLDNWEDSFLSALKIEDSFDPKEVLKGKRILILTDLFPPHFAPRIVSIVRYFVKWGASCNVFTEDIKRVRDKAHGRIFEQIEDPCPVCRIPLRKHYNKIESLKQILWQVKDSLFAKKIDRLTRVSEYDLILAFTFSQFPLKAALLLAQKYHKPLIVDCRDIYEQYNAYAFLAGLPERVSPLWHLPLQLLLKHLVRSRNKILRKTQAITTVSPWHQHILSKGVQGATPPVYCLFNGYEETLFVPTQETNDHFKIVFTGRLLSLGMRNPHLLFDALASTELQELVTAQKLGIYWYVDDHSKQLLRHLLASYPESVQRLQHFCPMVPFEQVPKVLSESSLILLLNNREESNGPHGIVSTKIFEAMAMQKPILSIPGDGAISDAILQRANVGTSCSSSDEVMQFLKACYRSWQKNGYTCTENADRAYIQHFTRQNIACAFARLTEKVWRASCSTPSRIEQTKPK